jgi:hypothetical protein
MNPRALEIMREALESIIAGLLSVDDAFVMKLIETGKLHKIKLDAQTVRISESSFKSFLANLQKQNTPECHGPVP